MIREATKLCRKCDIEKPVTAFYASKSNCWCRECTRIANRSYYRRVNPMLPRVECRRCRRQLDRRGVRGRTLATGICWRCRQTKGTGKTVDHGTVCRLLRSGTMYRDIAREVGCALSTVKLIAANYGLQRPDQQARPKKQSAGKNRRIRWLIEQHNGDHVSAALEAYRRCRAEGEGSFRAVTADDVVREATDDWREQVRLLCEVSRRAHE